MIDLASQWPILLFGAGGVVLLIFLLSHSGGLNTEGGVKRYKNAPEAAKEDSLSYLDHLRLASNEAGEGRYQNALEHLQGALLLKPEEAGIHFKMGRLFGLIQDKANAIQAYRNTVSLQPEHPEALFELARLYSGEGQQQEALEQLDRLLTLQPAHLEAGKLKAKILIEGKRFEEAIPILEPLSQNGALEDELRLNYLGLLSECYVGLNQSEHAINALNRLKDADPANLPKYESQLGQLYFNLDQYEQAVSVYRALYSHGKHRITQDPALKAQVAVAMNNLGVQRYDQDRYTEAMHLYLEAIGYDPNNGDIFYNLGKLYAVQKQVDSAIENFTESARLDPDEAAPHLELASLYEEAEQPVKAMPHYNAILTMDPGHAKAAFGLGTCFGLHGNYKQAIRYLTHAIKQSPQFVDAIYNLGVALEETGDCSKAIQMYKRVLQLDPRHIEAKTNLAHLKKSVANK